ncbi:4-hydroxy-3-methylbut-2-enyl diphosphate reductase, partial [Trifolium pratense]
GKLVERTMMRMYMVWKTLLTLSQFYIALERQDAIYKLVEKDMDRMLHGELVEKENFLPKGSLRIGVTSSASKPDKVYSLALHVK